MNFLVLDFDGVLNLFPRKNTIIPDNGDYFSDYSTFKHPIEDYDYDKNEVCYRDYEVMFSENMIECVNNIVSREDVQLVWLTFWEKTMRLVEPKLGIKPCKKSIILEFQKKLSDYHGAFGKRTALKEFIIAKNKNDSVEKIVWVDDKIHESADLSHYDTIRDNSKDLLVLSPNDEYGMSRISFLGINSFLNKN